MGESRHILLAGTGTPTSFTSTASGSRNKEYSHPARDREQHADKLAAEVNAARHQAEQHVNSVQGGLTVRGLTIECVSSINDALETDSLDNQTSKLELLSTRSDGNRTFATSLCPRRKARQLPEEDRTLQDRDTQTKLGEPKNKALVESIDEIRRPIVRSFWTDLPALYPQTDTEKGLVRSLAPRRGRGR